MSERGFVSGLRAGLAPMLAKEFRSRTRGWRSPLLISIYLLLLGGGAVAFFHLSTIGLRYGSLIRPNHGAGLFAGLAFFQLLALLFIVPALTAGAISGEKERRTLDLLMMTPASTLGIVLGKLVAALSYVFLLLAVSLPIYGLVYLFGGVPLKMLGMVLAVSVMTALLCGSIGIFASTVFRRTQVASITAYVLILFLLAGTVVGAVLMSQLPQYALTPGYYVPGGPGEVVVPRIPPIIYANPAVALVSVFPGEMGRVVPFIGDIFLVAGPSMVKTMYAYGGQMARTVPLGGGGPSAATSLEPPPKPLAPWVYNFIFDAVAVVVLLGASAVFLGPVRPWHRWRASGGGPAGGGSD